MPVDHRRKLLFIHIPKTGGTSISTILGLRTIHRSASLDTLFGDFGSVALEHLTVSQAEQFLTGDEFASYFRFSFVRNPWDRAVSSALWMNRHHEESIRDLPDFLDWAERVNQGKMQRLWDVHASPQVDFVTGRDQKSGVVHLGRFESYADDVKAILGPYLKDPLRLPHEQQHRDRLHYRDYYNGALQKRVAKLYSQDVTRFDYSF